MTTNDKKILVVQLRSKAYAKHEKSCFKKAVSEYYNRLEFINLFKKSATLPNTLVKIKQYAAVIIAGSGEVGLQRKTHKRIVQDSLNTLIPFTKLLLEKDYPTLGICLGHQLIGQMLGAEVVDDPQQKEVGTYKITLTAEGRNDSLFGQLDSKFLAQEGHNHSLNKLPNGCILLAKTKRCPIHAMKYKNNIYTVQYHPEIDRQNAIDRNKLYIKLNPETGYSDDVDSTISKLKDSSKGSKILKIFIKNNQQNINIGYY